MLDGQGREKAANLLIAELSCRSAMDEGLEPSDPKAIGFEGPAGIIPQLNCTFQVAVFPLPGGCGWTLCRGAAGRELGTVCRTGQGWGTIRWRRVCSVLLGVRVTECRELMIKARILWDRADEEPDGRRGMMALVNGVAFGGQLGEKGAERGGGGWWIVEFLAEIEIEPDPFVVFRTLGLWHPGLVEPPLETSDEFCGKGLHHNTYSTAAYLIHDGCL
jgi:hypothetical protein